MRLFLDDLLLAPYAVPMLLEDVDATFVWSGFVAPDPACSTILRLFPLFLPLDPDSISFFVVVQEALPKAVKTW